MASVFGVPIEPLDIPHVLLRVRDSFDRALWIVTANPEILLHAQEHPEYAAILRRADMRLVDGMGLALVLRLRGEKVMRIPGVDLAQALITLAVKESWRVAFVGGFGHVAEESVSFWRKTHPSLEARAFSLEREEEDLKQIRGWNPAVILVALGGGMKQESWIDAHKDLFLDARVIVGVGGAFDMWAGRLPRAPRWMRAIGLEWLWRFFLEPKKRALRIWRATVVFLWSFFTWSKNKSPTDKRTS